jgi:hypothetical protein
VPATIYEPIYLIGTGAIWAYDTNGDLRFIGTKGMRVGLALNHSYGMIRAGDSPYPDYIFDQDRDDKITIENAEFDINMFAIMQGASVSKADDVQFDKYEEFALGAGVTSYTLSEGATLVPSSDEIYYRDSGDSYGTKLARVDIAPTAREYQISAAGTITFHADDAGKKYFAIYKHTQDDAISAYLTKDSKTVPFKLVHSFKMHKKDSDDIIYGQLTVFKCQALGAWNLDQQRKQATAPSCELQILDPGITADNPSGKAVEFKWYVKAA